MSRGRKRGNTPEETKRILDSEVRLDGKGEDPLVQDVLRMSEMSEEERARVVIGLAEQLSGQELSGEKKTKIIERAKQRDISAQEFEQDRQRNIEQTYQEAKQRLHQQYTPEQLERKKANAQQKLEEAIRKKQADKATVRQKIKHRLETDPKESIHVSPQHTTLDMGGGKKRSVEHGMEINVEGFTFVLKPGMNKVPKYVAERYREIMEQKRQSREREKLLQDRKEMSELSSEWRELDRQFGEGELGAMDLAQGADTEVFVYGESG